MNELRVALTGAAGFVGQHVARALERRGATPLPVAREGAAFAEAPAADALVHLAFPTRRDERRRDPLGTFERVVATTTAAVGLAASTGARHLVLASSGKVYGAGAPLPIRDDTPPRRTTPLGRLKLAAEEIARAGAAASSTALTVLRIFNVYGPGQPPGFFFPTLLEGLARGRVVLGELDHARDFVDVRDVAGAIVATLAEPPAAGAARIFNVATGCATSARQILAIASALIGKLPEAEVLVERLREREASVERATAEGLRALGWEPAITLERGIAELLASR